MVNFISRFNFFEAVMFSRIFEEKKQSVQKVLVLDLVEISKDFLIFISILIKITETRFDSEPVCYLFVTCLLLSFK